MRPAVITAFSFFLLLTLSACQTTLRNVSLTKSGELSQISDVEAAVEKYFTATTPTQMREAVEAAKVAGPTNGDYHFIAADLAKFDDRGQDRFDHLVESVRDVDSRFSALAIRYLWYMAWDFEQQQIADNLFAKIAQEHPDPRIRTFAAYGRSYHLLPEGDLQTAKEMADSVTWRLPFTIIGTWNNEQGKGFDMQFEPEEEIDLTKKYVGQFVEIGWRQDPVLNPRNQLDLTEMFYPYSWAMGYSASSFESKEKCELELRLSTSDALKVWVNERLVFSDRKIESSSFDTIVIPISVNKGVNRILIKLSQDGDSTWNIFGRLTKTDGVPVESDLLTTVPADTKLEAVDTSEAPPLDAMTIIESSLDVYGKPGPVRSFAKACWTDIIGLPSATVEASEAYVKAAPGSFRAKYTLALALWDNQERAKANLVLSEMFEQFNSEFVEIALKQARFWKQNELEKKSRALLIELVEKYPESINAKFALARWYSSQEWEEDRCFILEELYQKWPGKPKVIRALAKCYSDLDFDKKVLKLHGSILDEYPYNWTSLMTRYNYTMAALDYKTAEAILGKLRTIWPNDISLLAKLAEVKRVQNDFEGAKQIIKRIQETLPDSPWSYNRLAHLEYYEKNKDGAVELWKEGLKRSPDDGDLEERLGYLSPTAPEPWRVDVPTKEHLLEAVAMREKVQPHPGANTILLLDNEVVKLNTDGSSVGVITSVIHSLNIDGRDAITTHGIGCGGRTKVLSAFSVSPDGQTTEASSIDGNRVKFRGLEVGSTIATQSRCERSPDALIGNYFSAGWTFQGFRRQFIDSRYTLWMAKDEKIKEFTRGEIKRKESTEGNLTRISWHSMNPPVLMPEPRMPPSSDIAWRLQLSTVPDWSMFYNWEEALLLDAFRQSPEIIDMANLLFEGVSGKEAKLQKIQAYLSQDIRYKKEYENPIAGVKPHPAPMVLSRGYGDCKDKSVFFIVLAKLAGIEAKFAILRTRNIGQVVKETPAQQFNHAIVYVPKQEGLEDGHFYDPTADGLDVDVIRSDDPGTEAFVIDLDKKTFEWVEIPFNSPDDIYFNRKVTLDLAEDGSAAGNIQFDSKGYVASQIRLISRNEERFQQVLQVLANSTLPGAKLDDASNITIQDVNEPVQFSISAKSQTFARKDGKELSFKIPFAGSPEKNFVQDKRTFSLILGTPSVTTWTLEINLPAGSKIKKTPKTYKMDTKCIKYDRVIKRKKKTILVEQTMNFQCERIPVEEYFNYKTELQKLRQVLEDDIVIKVKK